MIVFTPYRCRSHEPLHCGGFRDEKQASLRGVMNTKPLNAQEKKNPTKTLPVRASRVTFPSSAVPDVSTPTSALKPTQISLCCGINKISFQSHFFLSAHQAQSHLGLQFQSTFVIEFKD